MTGSGPDEQETLAAERAVNEQYRTKLKIELERTAHAVAEHTSLSRNSIWVSGTISSGSLRGEIAPVVGRVALDGSEEVVDGEMYVGPRILELDGDVTVVSWAAPVAELFYKGRQCGDPAASTVLGRRTFTTKGTDLEGYVDDLEVGVDGSIAFRIAPGAAITVPAAPRPTRRPRPKPTPRPPEPATPEPAAPTPNADEAVETEARRCHEDDDALGLRAEAAVREIVERPRTGQLTSVLSTLQPDQYELVTWPSDRPLIVSGQPGTGKTVVAMHRAGYLTHPEHPGGPVGDVVVVGPTDEYRDHVRMVSASVGGADVAVRGLPSFLARLAQINAGVPAPGPHDRIGVDWRVWTDVHRAARAMGVAGSGDPKDVGALVKALVTDSEVHRSHVSDPELSAWLQAVGSFQNAQSHYRYLPFLATAGVAVMPHVDQRVDHLIVDEAQDVPPLVWHILLSFVREGGSVSLFGDMNQRRSDWTSNSWEELAVDLELTDDEGVVPLRNLQTGYRTTKAILRFANQLLPRSERTIHAIRDGEKPDVRRVGSSELIAEVCSTADGLSLRHPDGLAAVISREPKRVSDEFRRRGWRRGAPRDSWESDGRTVFVFHPDRARGLEFDAVVVVEPDDFPQNVGRDGVLYTSLTRATKELAVIYSGKLPTNLRRLR